MDAPTSFTTDSFRDQTFDLLSGIASDPTKFDEFTSAYLTKLHERKDADQLRKYTRNMYEKLLNLQPINANPGFQLKDAFHEKIIVAFFWTSSNMQSLHMMPKLISIDKHLSSAGVAVIGIHCPKYEHEKNKANIRHTVDERSLPFHIINDNGLQLWKHVECQIYPTVLVFGPDALPIFIFEGENHVQHTEAFLQPILAYYKSSIRASPSSATVIKMSPEDTGATSAALNVSQFTYPTYLCVTSNGQLCISFTGSNQLILCEVDGKVNEVVGNGHSGMADGEIHQVEFDSPHGLVEYNSCIYIADTNNHAIRVFDPNSRRVLTLIGTGRLGNDKVGGLKRSQQPIASPWDVCIAESPFDHKVVLLISMTGQHQIWAYGFEETQWWNDIVIPKNSCMAIVGSGEEGNRNDSSPMSATLSAPRGICNGKMNDEPVVFIADSNSSSIRVVSLQTGAVTNLVGGDSDPTNLSAFGDLDGSGFHARLQHPYGVTFHYPSSHLYISDTYNNKLKRIDMNTGVCSTYFVTDTDTKKQRGETNSAKFNEPQGLDILDHFMFLADKNNSHIKRIDLNKGTIVRCRFNLREVLNEERLFGSKQAYLSIELPHTLHLRDNNTGTWSIEDQDGFKLCDGELTQNMSDQMLLDYIPRDKEVAHLKYELVVCEGDKCTMMTGEVKPVDQTDSTIDFVIKIDRLENSTH